MKLIDTQHSRLLEKAMDAYAMRQKSIASNVSNIDTPGYKRLEVSFEDKLKEAQEMGLSNNMDKVEAEVRETDAKPILEDELMEMADNQLRFRTVSKSVRHSFGLLRQAIREGRG
ncbi:MAG: flagellar basal body rod protein FlgB [Bacteroidota bacterium]|jgi:flagellar basal-body rod protein FlgB